MSIYTYLYRSKSIYIDLYRSICRYLSVSVGIYRYLSVSIGIYRYLSVSIGIYRYLSVSIGILYLYIYIYLSFYLPVYISIYLSIHLSIHLPTYLSIYLPIYLSIYLWTIHSFTCIYIYVYILIYSTYTYRSIGKITSETSISQCLFFLSWVRLPSGNEQRWTTGWLDAEMFLVPKFDRFSRVSTLSSQKWRWKPSKSPICKWLASEKKHVHIFWRIIHLSEKKNNWNRAICGRFTGLTWPNHRFLCFHVRVTEENFVLHGWCLELLTRWSQAWTIDTIGVETRTSFLGANYGLYTRNAL